MYRCDVFQKQQSGYSVGSGLKEYRGLSDKICCTVLEKHNITPKSIWLGVGFQILRDAMLPFFILLDPIISNLMGMAQTPICTPPKASPGNGGQLVFLKGFCIPCFMPFHVPGSYRHVCFQKGKYWRDYKLKHKGKHSVFFFFLMSNLDSCLGDKDSLSLS